MRDTYIKPTSHTQQSVRRAKSTLDEILEKLGIDEGEWLLLFFEYGCRNAENYIPKELLHDALTDISKGYWGWWITEYLRNDDALLSYSYLSIERYKEEKEAFLIDRINKKY